MFSKILGSALGLLLYITLPLGPFAFLGLGVLPIWFEVVASAWTGFEPAREQRRGWVVLDAVVDGLVFIWIPAFCFAQTMTQLWPWTLWLFLGAGTFRLVRFVLQGLGPTGAFSGLPVTYTGYIWTPLAWALGISPAASTLLALLAFAMVFPGIRVKPSR